VWLMVLNISQHKAIMALLAQLPHIYKDQWYIEHRLPWLLSHGMIGETKTAEVLRHLAQVFPDHTTEQIVEAVMTQMSEFKRIVAVNDAAKAEKKRLVEQRAQQKAEEERAQIEALRAQQQRLIAEKNARLLAEETRRQKEEAKRDAERAQRARLAQEQEAARIEAERQEGIRLRLISEALQKERMQAIRQAKGAIWSALEHEFLTIETQYTTEWSGLIDRSDFIEMRRTFVRQWVMRFLKDRGNPMEYEPNGEQLDAIAAVDADYQVVARAGSGKTMTTVFRTVFLLEHCLVAPHAIMLLAFNTKAAHEIRIRLFRLLYPKKQRIFEEKRTEFRLTGLAKHSAGELWRVEMDVLKNFIAEGIIVLPFVLTFHSLAYRIMQPDNILVDVDDVYGERSGVVSSIVSRLVHDLEKGDTIRKVMLARYRADYDRLLNDKNYLEKDEYLQYRRSIRYITLQNENVKSLGEKRIANFLFEHNIPYKYEKSVIIDEVKFRPDFTISLQGTHKSVDQMIIEFYGMQGRSDYDTQIDEKNRMWKNQPRTVFVPLYPTDVQRIDFEEYFAKKLSEQGITCKKLSEDQIWERIRDLGAKEFTKSTQSFLDRVMQENMDAVGLRAAMEKHSWHNEFEERFVTAMVGVMEGYERILQAENTTDFTKLLQQAAVELRKIDTIQFYKKTCDIRLLRFVCVDEFQDVSQLFMELIQGLRYRNSQIRLFCVGDDWQSINGFAGAKLHFFQRASEYFPGMRRIELLTNFRSASAIVEYGNELMSGLGSLARASETAGVGSVRIYVIDAFEAQKVERKRHGSDPQVPLLLRMIQELLSKKRQHITVLSRTHMLAEPINASADNERTSKIRILQEELHRYLPKWAHGYVHVSTVHSYKGMESDFVIIVDALEQRYPLIHPDWILTRIFGNSIEEVIEDERRLFYVGVTRAKAHLVVLTQIGAATPFLSYNPIPGDPVYLRSVGQLNRLAPLKRRSEKMTVHVGTKPTQFEAIEAIKSALVRAGYRYSNPTKTWNKTFQTEALKNIIAEEWIPLASGVHIEIFDEYDQCYAKVDVDAGEWVTIEKNEANIRPILSEND